MTKEINQNIIEKNTDQETVLVVSNLYKSFGENHVLVDLSLELKKGESVVVVGKSGSGKSVLIKCIIGLLKPDEGTIEMFGKNIPDLNEEELDELRSKVGFLFQSNALYDSMTIRENLEFPLRRHWVDFSQEEVNTKIVNALTDVGLEHTIDMMPEELSGGMRKRVALARTLILNPEIILYDEPTTGLDPITASEILELMKSIQKKYNTASLIISHDMYCVRTTSDRVIILLEGKCYASGTYEELIQNQDTKVKQFFQ